MAIRANQRELKLAAVELRKALGILGYLSPEEKIVGASYQAGPPSHDGTVVILLEKNDG